MFKTLRSRILMAVSSVLLVTLFTIMFFAQQETGRAVFDAHDRNARNLVEAVTISIECHYRNLRASGLEPPRIEKSILAELRQTLSKIRIAESGYMYLFSGNREMLLHPRFEGRDYRELVNPDTGNSIIDDLIDVSGESEKSLVYTWDKPPVSKEFKFPKKSYVAYFEPLDWYICSSVYIDEMEKPGRQLQWKILYVSVFLLVVAFALALLLSRNLSRPIHRLAEAANEIEEKGVTYADISVPISGTVETRKLGVILGKLLRSFRSAMRDKERLLKALETNYNELVRTNSFLRIEVDERRQVETQLDYLRSLLSNIVNSMPSIIVGVDGGCRVTWWNSEAKKVTGVDSNEAEGRQLGDLLPHLAGRMDTVRQAIRERRLLKDSKHMRLQEGEKRFYDIAVYPLRIEVGGSEGAVIRIDDVTERVRIEEIMIQTEKMMSIGGLAAGMAHEINNPLAGIMQNVQVIRNRLNARLEKNRKAAQESGISLESLESYMEKREIFCMMDSVMDSGKRAAKIVENMLTFSRRSEARHCPRDMAALLEQTLQLAANDYDLKKKYDFRKIELLREYAPSVPLVRCDAAKIQQVFLNLLKNGAQAMAVGNETRAAKNADGVNEDQGDVPDAPISTFTLRVQPDEEEGVVRIEVEDNGPGIKESVKNRIFEPFFTTKGVGVGTGLGLSVAYFIITENHKGTMAVESVPGRGTKFIIRLPVSGGAE